jgi:hypothetical protein
MESLRAFLPLATLSLTGALAHAQAPPRLTLGTGPDAACLALATHKIPIASFSTPSGPSMIDSATLIPAVPMAVAEKGRHRPHASRRQRRRPIYPKALPVARLPRESFDLVFLKPATDRAPNRSADYWRNPV